MAGVAPPSGQDGRHRLASRRHVRRRKRALDSADRHASGLRRSPPAMTETAPPPLDASELVPGWLIRLAAVGWRLLAAIALGVVLVQIIVVLWTVTASIL